MKPLWTGNIVREMHLPRDKLMYVAGAVTALAATSGDERNREEK